MSQHYLAMIPWLDIDPNEKQESDGIVDSKIDAIVQGYKLDDTKWRCDGFGDGYFNNYVAGNGRGIWLSGNGSGEGYGYCG